MNANRTITLDLVPYQLDLSPSEARIHDIGRTHLASLDNRPEVTEFKGSEESRFIVLGESVVCEVSVEPKDAGADLVVRRVSGQRRQITQDRLVDWLSQSWDAIDSIGWEALLTDSELERRMAWAA